VTGHALAQDINEFLAAGADLILLKPLQPHQLNALLIYIQVHGYASCLHNYTLAWQDEMLVRVPVEETHNTSAEDR
jgi:CheY-like chemotaxis protein